MKEGNLLSGSEKPDKDGNMVISDLTKSFAANSDSVFSFLTALGMIELPEDSDPIYEPADLEELLYDGISALVYEAFNLGQLSGLTCASVDESLKQIDLMKEARLALPRSGRQAQFAAQLKKRLEVEEAIRSMPTFAKSDAHARNAAIVVLEKTGHDIPWQTIKSSYLLKMDRHKPKGAV